ncbi:MAG: triose-phosphate isomerase [Bacteroidetes bacterium]|jgi:triosephosphate isomerase|nr:triose-phosphate isomerase [Bacteroidota bacterium]
MRRKIVAGNWKMNKNLEQGMNLIDEIIKLNSSENVLKIFATPFIHITSAVEKIKDKKDFAIAAQNCHHMESGAYTGEVSASMVRSSGTEYIIIGHSERRSYFNETTPLLVQKLNIALANDLIPIFCVGENLEDRNNNNHLEVIRQQLKDALYHLSPADFSKLIIAYEPIWAIGTGVTATTHQAQGMHNFIRSEINKKYGKEISENISILYGGSCNAENAKELFACLDVDGGLVGGASLKANDFTAIANSF